MKCVIMQPTFLPYVGYFNLIAQADHFVFLDDVQYEKTSWQNRNRVLIEGKPHWITVPAKRENLSQKMADIQIDDHSRWREKLVRLISLNYSKHPHIQDVMEVLEPLSDPTITFLVDLNIRLIESFSKKMGLSSSFVRSSQLGVMGARSERLVKICKHLSCSEYLSPLGAKEYLKEDGNFEDSDVRLTFQNYVPEFYEQRKSTEFVSHLSIVDVVANLGWKQTLEYVKLGQGNLEQKGNRNEQNSISA